MIATSWRLFCLLKIYVATSPWTRRATEAKSHRSKIIMSVAVSRRHHEHRSTIADTSWRNRRVIHPRCSYASATYALRDLVTVCTLSLRPTRFRGDCAIKVSSTLALLPRFRYALGGLANSRPGSSVLLVGVALLDSRTTLGGSILV